ncbi:MAG: hypothetical protein GXO15_06060 [Crenarchaeota archaeon]|nr:hypothetical protein [Thermoproteota archaeon]
MSYVRVFPLALVLAGVPLPGRHDPYLVVVSRGASLSVRVELAAAEGSPSLRFSRPLGWRVELPLKSFLDTVSGRLEEPIEAVVEVEWEGVEQPPSATLYAAVSLALLEAVAAEGGYTLERGELLEAARSIDEDAGAWYDFVEGLRTAMLEEASLVYRYGEEPLRLGGGSSFTLRLAGEETVGEDVTGLLGGQLLPAVGRLAGLVVVELVGDLREHGWRLEPERWRLYSRLENGLYYMLYGAQPPPEGCKWTPGLQGVYGVCSVESGVGDPVEFTL